MEHQPGVGPGHLQASDARLLMSLDCSRLIRACVPLGRSRMFMPCARGCAPARDFTDALKASMAKAVPGIARLSKRQLSLHERS